MGERVIKPIFNVLKDYKEMFIINPYRYSENPYLEGLVASWQMENDVTDYTGNHDGTANSITYTTGQVSDAASFNGTSSYISVSDDFEFSFLDASSDLPFSICFWVNFNSTTGNQDIINKIPVGGSGYEWLINKNDNNVNFVLYGSGGVSAYFVQTYNASAFTTSTWYHLAFTYDGSETIGGMEIYLNGSLVSTSPTSFGTYSGMSNTTTTVNIGSRGGTQRYLNGYLDEVKVWKNRELTSTEINDIYTKENAGNSIL